MCNDHHLYPAVDPIRAGIRGRCPRCGEGKLFSGFLSIAKRCNSCGLDYAFADSGDGPVAFVILIAGFVVLGLALWLETNYQPPLWLHLMIWIPLAIALSLVLVRWLKAIMIALQYRHKAAQGRLDDGQ